MDKLPDLTGWNISPEFVRQALDIIQMFEFKVDSIRRQPDLLPVISESEDFKLGLHCVVGYRLICEDQLGTDKQILHNHGLVCEKYLGVQNKNPAFALSVRRQYLEPYLDRMKRVLDQVRELGLGTYIHSAEQSRQADMKMRTLLSSACTKPHDWLRSVVLATVHLRERHMLCPAWVNLEAKFAVHLRDFSTCENDMALLILRISHFCLPEHAAHMCARYSFHCRYLDEELRNLAMYADAQCNGSLTVAASLLTASDLEFSNICLRNIDTLARIKGPISRFLGVRLYRICLRTGSYALADKWMNLRFDVNLDKKDIVDTLHETITSIREMKQLPFERIKLNGEHEGVGPQTQYKLPELKEEVQEAAYEKPWWVEEFGNRIKGIFPSVSMPASTGDTCSSTADTVLLSTEEYDALVPNRPSDPDKETAETSNAASENQRVSWVFTHNDKIRDYDTYSFNFSLPDGAVQDSITLEWTDRQGEKQNRKTNIKRKTPYHCRVLSYDVSQDEWVITSDFCRVTGLLTVEEKGSSCEPLFGECGYYRGDDVYVFKVHRDPRHHTLRNYLSEIRSQCTASYYVDKFSRLTVDRFECLRMLSIDCLLLFADSDRKTIIDIMTREERVEINEIYKPVVKFIKFTNNTCWKNPDINTALLEAFAHYTYHESDGVLMVADLQGWLLNDSETIFYTLTDPVIHCPKRPVRFGETNQEEKGISLFFTKIHPECNDICRELHLKRPPELDNTDTNI